MGAGNGTLQMAQSGKATLAAAAPSAGRPNGPNKSLYMKSKIESMIDLLRGGFLYVGRTIHIA
jgi:hypothetical protein